MPPARRLVFGGSIAARTWRARAAACAGVRAFPWLILLNLTYPAGVFAEKAPHMRLPCLIHTYHVDPQRLARASRIAITASSKALL
jgi:hypothetical protein